MPFSLGTVWLGALLIAAPVFAQDLPTSPVTDSALEFEPQLMLQDIPDLPELAITTEPEATEAVEKAKRRLDQARGKQARWQKLAKQGVLSRSEAESCAIDVATALVRHEQARAEQLRLQLEAVRQRIAGGNADATLGEAAEASWKSAVALAEEAATKLLATRRESAEVNLQRHRRLRSAGLVSPGQLKRAEAALLKLQSSDLAK